MSTMLFSPGRQDALPYERLAEEFRDALAGVSILAHTNEPMLFWILITGGLSVFREDEMLWLLPWMKTIAVSLGLNNWSNAREQLCKYPWVPVFHDGPGQELWERIDQFEMSS
jgi:hypothetical protein